MIKNNFKIIIEIVGLLLLAVLFISISSIAKRITINYNPYSFVAADFMMILYCFIVGIYINAINKRTSFKRITFDRRYFIIFLLCVVIIASLWLFMKYLPHIILIYFDPLNYLISIYAGAVFVSSLYQVEDSSECK
jgi:hypothetical protein